MAYFIDVETNIKVIKLLKTRFIVRMLEIIFIDLYGIVFIRTFSLRSGSFKVLLLLYISYGHFGTECRNV